MIGNSTQIIACVIASIVLVLSASPAEHATPENDKSDAQDISSTTTYLSDIQEQMRLRWPKNKTINIVTHGHSVPAGYFKTPKVDTFNAYPHLLHVALKKQYPHAVLNVINTSIGGENAVKGENRFEEDVLTHRPDLITIDYALNDRAIGLEQSYKAWESMINMAKKKGIPVLLLTPTWDTRSDMDDPEDPLNLHAEQIRRLAKTHGVGLVDSHKAFSQYVSVKDNLLSDIMSTVNHPNRKGHELVLSELIKWFPE